MSLRNTLQGCEACRAADAIPFDVLRQRIQGVPLLKVQDRSQGLSQSSELRICIIRHGNTAPKPGHHTIDRRVVQSVVEDGCIEHGLLSRIHSPPHAYM